MSGLDLGLYAFCIGLSTAGAWIVGRYGHRLGLLDKPNDRSSHRHSTPKGGAVGILAAFILVSLALKLPGTFWMPAAMLSIISFIGDWFGISPYFRLLFQFAASIIFLAGFWNDHGLTSQSPLLIIIILAVYVVATANYYNFMDGINGIAGISGVLCFGFLAFFSHSRGSDPNLTILSISLSLSCLGFLPFNMPHAKVFMGDVGSILLGFVFAGIVVFLSKSLSDFICLASFLFPFYGDEIITLGVRIRDGVKLTQPHRKHLYQLMANELKIRHWKISVGYGLVQLIIGASILIIRPLGIFAVLSILIIYFAGFAWVSYFVRRKIRAMGKDYKSAHSFHA